MKNERLWKWFLKRFKKKVEQKSSDKINGSCGNVQSDRMDKNENDSKHVIHNHLFIFTNVSSVDRIFNLKSMSFEPIKLKWFSVPK